MGAVEIPRIVHFVFGLAPQNEPFHLLHYLAIESCRRVWNPERIYLHYKNLPFGVHWDLARPHLQLVEVDEVPEVLGADYDEGLVPQNLRYAHHADFVRLDALIEHGGVYADIDTLFLRPLSDELFRAPFVIGEEDPVRDERTGSARPSLCNAILLSRPAAPFAVAWRKGMAAALDGTWSNHSGFLARALADEMPDQVRIEPKSTFFPASCSIEGLRSLLELDELDATRACSVHLWSHLWWPQGRQDFSPVHAGMLTDSYIRSVDTSLNRMARPYLPSIDIW